LYRNGSFYGAVLLCAGAPGKRSALHSRVMIHQPSGGAQELRLIWSTCVKCWNWKMSCIKLSLSTQDKLW
jgi:hypothetical protein